MASSVACAVFGWLWPSNRSSGHQHIRGQLVQHTHYQSGPPMKLPTGPKALLSSSYQCPSQPDSALLLGKQCHLPVDKIVWIECYGGIAYGSLTGLMPVVLARAQTCFFPKGVPVYCSLDTYEQAPNSMAAAREVGENWDWVKKKYGKEDRTGHKYTRA